MAPGKRKSTTTSEVTITKTYTTPSRITTINEDTPGGSGISSTTRCSQQPEPIGTQSATSENLPPPQKIAKTEESAPSETSGIQIHQPPRILPINIPLQPNVDRTEKIHTQKGGESVLSSRTTAANGTCGNGATPITSQSSCETKNSNQEFYFDYERFCAIPLSERNYIVQEVATGQFYQGLHLTQHYQTCFYKLADRVNEFQKHCSSAEEFIAFRNMAIPEGTRIVRDCIGRPKNPLIFLLLPERGDSFHTAIKRMSMSETVTVVQKVIKFMKLCHKVNLFFRDCKLQKFVQRSKNSPLTEIRLHNPFELFLSDSRTVKGRHRFTPFWAPEMFCQPEEYDGVATDVWSFGVFIYRVFVGKYPFVDNDPQGFMKKVRHCLYSPFPDDVSDVAVEFVNMILIVNAEQRPTVEALDCWVHCQLERGRFNVLSSSQYEEQSTKSGKH